MRAVRRPVPLVPRSRRLRPPLRAPAMSAAGIKRPFADVGNGQMGTGCPGLELALSPIAPWVLAANKYSLGQYVGQTSVSLTAD